MDHTEPEQRSTWNVSIVHSSAAAQLQGDAEEF